MSRPETNAIATRCVAVNEVFILSRYQRGVVNKKRRPTCRPKQEIRMRYALTAMVIALIAAISAWVSGASLGQALLVYVVAGIAVLVLAALLSWLSGNIARGAASRTRPSPVTAHKVTDRR